MALTYFLHISLHSVLLKNKRGAIMINSFQKYMCSTCKSKMCDKGITLIKLDNMIIAKCTDYEKDENKVKGYEKPKIRTAKQKKALMGFTQEY